MLHRNMSTVVVKKYSNRRLYDTDASKYITQEELMEKIRSGSDVRVVDAKSGDDLTQAMLTQIILETPAAKMLPVPLLMQLIRMQDDALGEFFGKYMSAALELYLSAKQGAQAVAPYFPFATVPFSAGDALARMVSSRLWPQQPAAPPPASPPEAEEPVTRAQEADDIAELRRELADLKREIRGSKRKR